jgi:fermentation-respiration switch protein FrsA (DUF1100 family)
MIRVVAVCCLASIATLVPADRHLPEDRAALGIAPTHVTLRNLTYLETTKRRVEATFVAPADPGPHPAVLFVHWLESESPTNGRTQFLPDALQLAKKGVASLHIDTPWSDPVWFFKRDPKQDLAMSEAWVTELGRALDVLAALETVDPKRLAYVGHDFGAMYGATLGARDRRPVAWVYIAGTDRYAEWFTLGRKLEPPARQAVFAQLAKIDPIEHIAAVAPAPILFQFGTKDSYVPRKHADALVAAATSPKEVKFYECGHEMNRHAMDDRIAWLVKVLHAKG